jgi:RNA polymerase sigma-70 factor (ECF subfamily)
MRQIEEMYRTHGGLLLAYLRRRFGWCASAEDLLQETFVQALRQEERLSAADSPRAWLLGIARHVGLTAARRRRPMEALDAQAPAPAVAADVADLRQAIEELPETLRETLELRLNQRLDYAEIAQVLGIPLGTVRSRLHSAMRRLRDEMEK